ncbi:MAG: fumarylacetoacetate hydrolase family protein [Actinophytocola sp.]|uniref:fumarylacetoacetate hydrolase family protein n=1 Tax=Actinophytocola sp. TaxID=1872138 RepID=UPI003C78F845
MKLVTFRHDEEIRHGRLVENGTVVQPLGNGDLTALLSGRNEPTAAGPAFPLADVELLAPLLRPGKLLAAAANYQDHMTEAGGDPLDKSRRSPRLFLKPPTSIVGPGADIPVPSVGKEVDWEAELAVVIGATARDVPVGRALDIVGGYVTSNDVSARSMDFGYERDTGDKHVRFFDWLAGKWLDGFAPMGPWLVTPEEVPDPQALDIRLDVNGKRRQDGSTKDMIFSVAELVSFASTLMTLEPGDVIMTGTPAGVGAATGEYLEAGDEMSVTIGGLGTLTNRMVVR